MIILLVNLKLKKFFSDWACARDVRGHAGSSQTRACCKDGVYHGGAAQQVD